MEKINLQTVPLAQIVYNDADADANDDMTWHNTPHRWTSYPRVPIKMLIKTPLCKPQVALSKIPIKDKVPVTAHAVYTSIDPWMLACTG